MCGKISKCLAVRLEEMQFDILSGEQPTDTFLLKGGTFENLFIGNGWAEYSASSGPR